MTLKRIIIKLMFCLFVSGYTTSAFALSYMAYDIWGGYYHDAEKSKSLYDDKLCWMATASNILAWTGWDAGFEDPEDIYIGTEDLIFDFLMQEYGENTEGWMKYAWRFWFSGTATGSYFVNSSHEGFYPNYNFYDYYHEDLFSNGDFMPTLEQYLKAGYGVGGSINDQEAGGIYHAVTFWGYEYDAVGNYLGVWITDSDNHENLDDPPDMLQYYDVAYNTTYDRWYLQDYYQRDTIYLESLQALARAPSVPEPDILLLLGSSLFGLFGLGLKRFKRN